jgi:acyl-CoA thioesterase
VGAHVTEAQLAFDRRLVPLDWSADERRASFELTAPLCRTDGVLFGATALSAALMAFETVTQRPALWATVQFVATTAMGATIDLEISRMAEGRRSDQVQLTGRTGDQLLFTALGATATRSDGGIAGLGMTPPAVAPPEACERLGGAHRHQGRVGHQLISEFREATLLNPDPARPGHMAMWGRVLESATTTSAKLGFLADMVPIASCRAAGVDGAGSSIDNTLRIVGLEDTEWVLIELDGQVAAGGYGHGITHLWTPDGRLLATGSQSAKLFSIAEFMARQAG